MADYASPPVLCHGETKEHSVVGRHNIRGATMGMSSVTASVLGLTMALSPIINAQAAELKVLAGGSISASLDELGPQFERASGHKVVIHFDSTPNLIKAATSGAPFDLGVVPVDVMKDAAARGRFAAGPTI